MVSSNRGYPDPENPTEELTPDNEIIIVTDTDTDDEESPYDDYEPLPTNDVAEASDEDLVIDSDSEEGAVAADNSLPSITRIEDTLVREVWAAPTPKAVDIVMDNTKVDEVKQAMENFTLPSSSIPEWANNVPEDQWKQQLFDRLRLMQKSLRN